MKTYYTLPNRRSFAFVARTGTSAIIYAAMEQLDFVDKWCCEPILPQDCVVVVREPVWRFRALLSVMQTTADEAIDRLANAPHYKCGRGYLSHFRPVSTLVQSDSRLIRFGDSAIWPALGLSPHAEIVGATPDFPVLTEKQENAVRHIYADDIALWESMT